MQPHPYGTNGNGVQSTQAHIASQNRSASSYSNAREPNVQMGSHKNIPENFDPSQQFDNQGLQNLQRDPSDHDSALAYSKKHWGL